MVSYYFKSVIEVERSVLLKDSMKQRIKSEKYVRVYFRESTKKETSTLYCIWYLSKIVSLLKHFKNAELRFPILCLK